MPEAATHQTMRDTLFRAAETHTARPAGVGVSPLAQKTLVYVLPGTAANDVKLHEAFHLLLVVAGTSDTKSRQHWQNYVATLVCLCLPEVRGNIVDNPGYEERVVPDAEVASLREWYRLYGVTEEEGADEPEVLEALADALSMCPCNVDLPWAAPSPDVTIADVCSFDAIYGHFSLVLFLAGKRVTDRNRAAITLKRPQALERKYFLGKAVASLTGSLQLSSTAHDYVHVAFSCMSHLRIVAFGYVAGFNHQTGDQRAEVVATTTRLMRFSGMQQAAIIDAFLSAHEEAFSVPLLAPAIAAYTASLSDLARAPAEVRPYYKVMYADTTRVFNRNDISTLLCVALDDAIALNPTLAQYNKPVNFQEVVVAYQNALALIAAE